MFTERAKRERDRKLEGFTLSPNPGVDLLESTLGIRFPIRPVAIALSPENKRMLFQKASLTAAGREIIGKIGTLFAYYETQFQAYFFNPIGDNAYVSAHENMHGFTSMINPKTERLIRSRNPEKGIVARCFGEGMSEWAAIEALYRSPNESDQIEARRQQDLKTHGVKSRRNFVDRNFRAVEISLIAKHISQMDLKPTSAFGQVIQGAVKAGSFGFGEYNFINPQYIVGYHFVSHAMHTLVDSAYMTVPEAMTFLIKHPPTEMSNLRKPEDYVASVLKRPISRIASLRRHANQPVDHIHAVS